MNKMLALLVLMVFSTGAYAQTIGEVDRKTKEFFVPMYQKTDYRVFGYQYPNTSTAKMICFSSHAADVVANYNNCPLGSYYDSGKLRPGEKIIYLGAYGKFAKMSFVSVNGKKTIFYLPRSSFVIK